MDDLLILLAFGLLALAVITPIVAFLAAARVRRAEQRLEQIERRLGTIGARVAMLEHGAPPRLPAEVEEGVPGALAPPPMPSHGGRTAQAPPEGAPAGAEEVSPPDPPSPAPVSSDPEPATAAVPEPEGWEMEEVAGGIDWERWLGVRGAALVGGLALVLAGLFFLQHAIQSGWFGPGLRVSLSAALGVACMAACGRIGRAGYPLLGNVLAGAGTVLEYGAAWAGWKLHGLGFVPLAVAFPWMAGTTVAAALLSLRHDSQVIALFALVGGFATPFLLDTTEGGPVALFGYVLVLDLGLIAIARRQRWPLVAGLGLLGTSVLQAFWFLRGMDAGNAVTGLVAVGGFALLFLARPDSQEGSERRIDAACRVAALGIASLFTVAFARRLELDVGPVALGALLMVLSAAACVVARVRGETLLANLAAAASTLVATAWLDGHGAEAASRWQFMGVVGSLALLFSAYAWFSPSRAEDEGARWPGTPLAILTFGAVLSLGGFVALRGAGRELAPLVTLDGLLLLLGWWIFSRGAPRLIPLLALAIGAGLGGYAQSLDADATTREAPLLLSMALAFALAPMVLARVARPGGRKDRRWSTLAAAAIAAPLLPLLPAWTSESDLLLPGGTLALAAVGALGAALSGRSWAYGALALAAAIAGGRWGLAATVGGLESLTGPALAWNASLAVLFGLLPLGLGSRPWRENRVGHTALCAPLLWLQPQMFLCYRDYFDTWTPVPLFLALALIPGVAFLALRRREEGGPVALAAAVASGLAAPGLSNWVGVEWLPMGAALAGLAWVLEGRALDQHRLRWVGLVTLSSAGSTLLALALVPGWFLREPGLLPPWISYAYLAPAAMGWMALIVLARDGRARLPASALSALGATIVLLIFAWINLAVINATGEGPRVVFELRRIPRRDLTQSLAWALFALVLLGAGTARRISGLRWMSLGFTILAVAKVFLYDLGELEGMYRVGSMAGLAVCLLLVSFLYQRFVFRRPVRSGE